MKISVLQFIFGLFFALTAAAQDGVFKYDLAPCGTQPTKYNDDFLAHQPNFSRNTDTILYVPLTIHLTATDAGGGRFPVAKMLESFCQLNKDFEPSKIQFYLAGDIKFENKTAWYNHDSIIQGANMMFANNVPNTINIYFCGKAAGNCGYNLPYGGVCVAKSCAGVDSHTWAHELGHGLRLPHPFLGWEGKTYSNATYAAPTPTRVTYDYTQFKDSLLTDTLIIDTTFVELVSSSNCNVAADQICDSKSDYLAFRWQCNTTTKKSIQIQKDPENVDFLSDGTLFMSYSFDECQNRFTDGQITTMRNYLRGPKAYLLANQTVPDVVSTLPFQPLSPIDSVIVPFYNAVQFSWQAVPNATKYLLQVSKLQDNFNFYTEYLVSGTTKTVTDLLTNRYYFWRVKPFNTHYFCAANSARGTFRTSTVSGSKDLSLEEEKIQIFPNPTPCGSPIYVGVESEKGSNLTLKLFDVSGKLLLQQNENTTGAQNTFSFNSSNFEAGIYFLSIETPLERHFRKIIIVK